MTSAAMRNRNVKISKRLSSGALAVVASLAVAGCETTGSVQDQAAGAGIGAVVGCGIGALVTGTGRGCATGAAIGGFVGWGAVALTQYNAQQVRSSSADSRIYGLTTPVDDTQVKIRRGTSAPKSVRPGDSVDISTDYSVMLPAGASNARVTESWALKKDGKTVANLPKKSASRAAGGWQADAEITIPDNVPAGTYVIEHKVKAGSSYDTDESTFVVRA